MKLTITTSYDKARQLQKQLAQFRDITVEIDEFEIYSLQNSHGLVEVFITSYVTEENATGYITEEQEKKINELIEAILSQQQRSGGAIGSTSPCHGEGSEIETRPDRTRESRFVSFLKESNKIEREFSKQALRDAISAWYYAETCFSQIELTVLDVLNIHQELLCDINPRVAGRIRECAVTIAGKLKPFVSIHLIESDIQNWIDKWWYVKNLSEDELKQSHIEFEAIHPFEDGNGRVGRILWNLMRLRNGYGIQIIHEGVEQFEYYKWFENT